MAFNGLNFRGLFSFIEDGAGDTFCVGDVYPTTRVGFTFGFSADRSSNGRDRNASVDPRIAGLVFQPAGSTVDFRLDLPETGTYRIRAAFGDTDNAQEHSVIFKDDTTSFATISKVSTSAGQHLDATGTAYSSANWPTSNSYIQHTFTSTILRLTLSAADAGAATCIQHLSFELQAGGGGGGQAPRSMHILNMMRG